MAEVKEKAIKNKVQDTEEVVDTKKTKKASKELDKTPSTNFLTTMIRFLKDERTHKLSGLVLCVFSIYLFIAQLSYLFTWQNDQDKVLGSWWTLIKNTEFLWIIG